MKRWRSATTSKRSYKESNSVEATVPARGPLAACRMILSSRTGAQIGVRVSEKSTDTAIDRNR